MLLRTGREAAARTRGIIQEKYQVHRYSVDLTVKSIFQFDPMGRVDFGGGEYVAAGRIPLASARMRTEDRYEWWDLSRGCYSVEFNETVDLDEEEIALLEPDPRLLRAGGTHTLTFLRGHVAPVDVLLIVGVARLQVKQNARISCLRLFGLSEVAEAAVPAGKGPAGKRLSAPKRLAKSLRKRR